MRFVLTLIANPERLELSEAMVAAVAAALDADGAEQGPPDWLAPGGACDLPFDWPFDRLDPDRVEKPARATLADRPVDLGCQPLAGRRKKLLLADMDATMVTGERRVPYSTRYRTSSQHLQYAVEFS